MLLSLCLLHLSCAPSLITESFWTYRGPSLTMHAHGSHHAPEGIQAFASNAIRLTSFSAQACSPSVSPRTSGSPSVTNIMHRSMAAGRSCLSMVMLFCLSLVSPAQATCQAWQATALLTCLQSSGIQISSILEESASCDVHPVCKDKCIC